jgi:hypothetical protein
MNMKSMNLSTAVRMRANQLLPGILQAVKPWRFERKKEAFDSAYASALLQAAEELGAERDLEVIRISLAEGTAPEDARWPE